MRYAKKMTEEDFKKWIREDFFNILIKNSKYTKYDFIKEWDNPTGILEYDIINYLMKTSIQNLPRSGRT